MLSDVFQIDTKGKCLLCMSTCNKNGHAPRKVASPTAFKMLLRYLKIDIMKRDNFSSTLLSPPKCTPDSNISVELCERCHSLTSQFHKFFQAYERIRMELDRYAGQLHDAIEEGVKDVERVREYRKALISPEKGFIRPIDTINANIVENLRRKMMEKFAKRISFSTPRVRIIPLESMPSSKRQKCTSKSTCSRSAIKTVKPVVSLMERDPLQASDSGTFDTPIAWAPDENEDANIDLTTSRSTTSVHCPHCRIRLTSQARMRAHLISIHTFLYFSSRLPPGTTEKQLNSTIRIALGEKVVSINRNGKKLCGCPLCRKPLRDIYLLKMHMLTLHFDELVSNYFPSMEQERNIVEVSSPLVDSEDYTDSPCHPVSDPLEIDSVKQPNSPEIEWKEKKPDEELGLNIFEDNPTEFECGKDSNPTEVDSDQQRQPEKCMVPDHNYSTLHKNNPGSTSAPTGATSFQYKIKCPPYLSRHRTGKVECIQCRKVLSNVHCLRIHIKEVHSGVRKRYRCLHCAKVFTRQATLRLHGTIHHTFTIFNNKFPSGTTEQDFKKVMKKVMSQMRRAHVAENGVTAPKFGCQFCEKIFMSPKNPLNRRAHILRYHLDHIIYSMKQNQL